MSWYPNVDPPVTRDIELSRGPDGVAQARVTCRPWTARERLAYTDLSYALGVTTNDDGDQVFKPATFALVGASLTLTAAEGFEPVNGQPFDPSNRNHLLALPPAVYDEVIRHALDVQPLPTGQDTTEAGEAAGDDDDPSRTPSPAAAPQDHLSRGGSRTSTR